MLVCKTNIVKNSDKETYVYSGYGIKLDCAGLWSSDNDTTTNVIIFGGDNGSSFLADNLKNNFLVLDEGPTFEINGSCGSVEKANIKFYFSLHCNADNSYLFVKGRKMFKITDNKNVNFPTQFCLGSISI